MNRPASSSLRLAAMAAMAAGVVWGLGGCGSAPLAPTGGPEATLPAPVVPTGKPSAPRRFSGGFYKDDGPGEQIPNDLELVPDAVPRNEPLHRFANRPYNVLGRDYMPLNRLTPYRESGIASWYGRKFHGQKTSIGEPYDMYAMTAAHPTLPLPSYVRVVSRVNGRAVVLRVIDRGPFHADRIIDLSYTAAWKLGLVERGSGEVDVEALLPDAGAADLTYANVAPPPASPPPARPASSATSAASVTTASAAATAGQGVWLQIGAFSSFENAEAFRGRLGRDLDWLRTPPVLASAGGWHRVQLGPYVNRADAEQIAAKVESSLGIKPAVVLR